MRWWLNLGAGGVAFGIIHTSKVERHITDPSLDALNSRYMREKNTKVQLTNMLHTKIATRISPVPLSFQRIVNT